MPACPRCGAICSASDTTDDRCATCGSFLPRAGAPRRTVAELPRGQSSTAVESAAPVDRGEPPERLPADLIRPRNLSPEFTRHFTAHWEATEAQYKHPRETLNSSSSSVADAAGLVIGARSVVSVADESRGDYELKDVIGEGNMGTVWSARQSALDRDVAVKMPKPAASKSELGRNLFISEVVVTGQLDHPNIVPIYDLGRDDRGQLFYSMKRVEGRPWNECMHDGSRTQQDNIEILMKVCDAIRFAHDRGVIHRDIKPHNVMVGRYGEVSVMDWGIAVRLDVGAPGGGVAKMSPAGTPAYMAPEMATVSTGEIGRATDVYLLGAVLFEIVTSEAPHPPPQDSQDVRQLQKDALVIAARNEIIPVGHTGELVDIAFKALATDITDRYQTVEEFQTAIRQYFAHAESIKLAERGQEHLAAAQASRNGTYEEFAKSRFAFEEALELWPENAKARTGLAEVTLAYADAALRRHDYALGISLLDVQNQQHGKLLNKLKAEKRKQNRNRIAARISMLAAATFLILGVVGISYFAYGQYEEQKKTSRLNVELKETNTNLNSSLGQINKQKSELQELYSDLDEEKKKLDNSYATLAKTNIALEAEKDNTQREKDRAERESYRFEIGLAAEELQRNAFASAVRILTEQAGNEVKWRSRGWEWGYLHYQATKQPTVSFDVGAGKRVESVAVSPDRRWVVAGTADGDLFIWQYEGEGRPVRRPVRLTYGKAIHAVAVAATSDGIRIAAAGVGDPGNHRVKIWRLSAQGSGEPAQELASQTAPILSVAFSKDAELLLTSAADGTAKLWNCRTNEELQTFHADLRQHEVWSDRFSPDERSIVTAADDGSVRIWDISSGSEQQRFEGHNGPALAVAFSPDGRYVVSGGRDGRLLVGSVGDQDVKQFSLARYERAVAGLTGQVDVRTDPNVTPLGEHGATIKSISFSLDGQHLFSASHDNTIGVWDVSAGVANAKFVKKLRGHGGWVRGCEATDDGRGVVSGGYDRFVRLWNWEDYEFPQVLRDESRENKTRADLQLTSAAVSHGGRWIATASQSGLVTVWDMQQPLDPAPQELQEGHDWQATTGVFFDQGKRLLTTGGDNTTLVWDAQRGNELLRIGRWFEKGGSGWRGVAAVAPNGRSIATGSDEPGCLVRLWDAQSGQLVASLVGPGVAASTDDERPEATALAFSPRGDVLFAGDQSGNCYLFDVTTKSLRRSFTGHDGKVSGAEFLPGGRYLMTAGVDGQLAKWDLQSDRSQPVTTLRHTDRIVAMALARDGTQVITATGSGQSRAVLRRWDTATGEQLSEYALPLVEGRPAIVRSVVFHATQPQALVTVFWPDRNRPYDVAVWSWQRASNPYRLIAERLNDASMAVYWPADRNAILTVGGRGARLRRASRLVMKYEPQGTVNAVSFSRDGNRLASAGADASVKLWRLDAATARWLPDQTVLVRSQAPVNSVVFAPDRDDLLLVGLDDGTAELWQTDADKREPVQRFGGPDGHTSAVSHAIFLPDSTHLLTVSDDQSAILWNRDTGRPVAEPLRLLAPGTCAAFGADRGDPNDPADDRAWIVVGHSNAVTVWDARSLRRLTKLEGHFAEVTSVAFTPDGKRLFTGSRDFTVKVWDSGAFDGNADQQGVREMLTLEEHTGEVTSVALAADQQAPGYSFLVSTGLDGQAILWPSQME